MLHTHYNRTTHRMEDWLASKLTSRREIYKIKYFYINSKCEITPIYIIRKILFCILYLKFPPTIPSVFSRDWVLGPPPSFFAFGAPPFPPPRFTNR